MHGSVGSQHYNLFLKLITAGGEGWWKRSVHRPRRDGKWVYCARCFALVLYCYRLQWGEKCMAVTCI